MFDVEGNSVVVARNIEFDESGIYKNEVSAIVKIDDFESENSTKGMESNEQHPVRDCCDPVEACHPKHNRKLPSCLKDFEFTAFVSFMSSKREHNEIPLTYDKAMASPRADEWIEVMKSEFSFLEENDV